MLSVKILSLFRDHILCNKKFDNDQANTDTIYVDGLLSKGQNLKGKIKTG